MTLTSPILAKELDRHASGYFRFCADFHDRRGRPSSRRREHPHRWRFAVPPLSAAGHLCPDCRSAGLHTVAAVSASWTLDADERRGAQLSCGSRPPFDCGHPLSAADAAFTVLRTALENDLAGRHCPAAMARQPIRRGHAAIVL